ncbi:hypothetical protein [Actinomycetospora atypica]|uniref:MarR family transcriptional regulator n=1 Tax=Actinomycetospora atypica TaxID=1290095 RepID=A0ABV9YE39_9PSEU
MALPVPESAAGTRESIVRMLADVPEGLSDRELAEALAGRHPGIDYKAVNHQCRRLVAVGAVERVGTKPVRTRLVDASLAVEVLTAPADAAEQLAAAPVGPVEEETPRRLPPVQVSVLQVLADSEEGLTDVGIAAALAPRHPDVDPKAFNYQCRKLVKAGLVERTARTKDVPIRTRLTDAGREALENLPDEAEDLPDETVVPESAVPAPEPVPEPEPLPQALPEDDDATAALVVGNGSTRPRHRPKAPSDDVARIRRSERAGDDPDEAPVRFLPVSPSASVALRERFAQRAALRIAPEAPVGVEVPTRDVHLGWSRTHNVAAAVASWLTRRGSTIRRVSDQGPALDLVAVLDGEEVHVEVTGWPPEGARSHPTTLAADWYSAASRAAVQRRRAHPRSRVVIALPDTRRYRSLAADDQGTLCAARTEIWFVDAAGRVDLT